MAPQSSPHRVKKSKTKWSMTVMMNARDLSRDDDFLSHLLVEHLGTDDAPLQVHKMDPSRRLPKHDPAEVMAILKKYIIRKGGASTAGQRVKRAVDALLELSAVKQYLHKRSTAQINAFATHASRYFELYLPNGSIEISHTSRYSHRTGKSELCILATGPLKVGQVISDLKGSLAHLTPEEDEELRKTDTRRRDGRIRRDFSVIHSNQKNKSHLFLGPARFVNHDCDHNVELFRDGRVITFRVIKPIVIGQEVNAHYGDGYFGKNNRHCLCHTCETLGRGGYSSITERAVDDELADDSSTDEETREARIKACLGLTAEGNPNERRTRRGVYAILAEEDTDDEDRVGATETIVKTGQSSLQESGKSASPDVPSTSSNLLSGNTHRSRRLSDAPSSLTSLSDVEKPPERSAENNGAHSLSHFASLSSLSSLDSLSSGSGTPNTPTKQPTRRSTRASTASPDKGNVQARLNSTDTPRSGSPRQSASSRQNSIERLERGRLGSLSNPSRTRNGNLRPTSLTKPGDVRRTSSLSKSATPVSTQSPDKKTSTPKCDTCSVDLAGSILGRLSRNSKPLCPRCKRHLTIYGASWPNRTANLEPLSSESSTESDSELAKVKDKYGKKALIMDTLLKRRKTDPILYASATKVTQDEHYGQFGRGGKHLNKFLDPHTAHRYMAYRALSSKEASPMGHGTKRKWDEMEAEEEYLETSLRRMASTAGFPIARPLPALWKKPSPMLFARSAWTTTAFVDQVSEEEEVETSESKPGSEKSQVTSSSSNSRVTRCSVYANPQLAIRMAGEKRDSFPEDKAKLKDKIGRTFYMNGKRKMPKGWVLCSSSSETDGETEGRPHDNNGEGSNIKDPGVQSNITHTSGTCSVTLVGQISSKSSAVKVGQMHDFNHATAFSATSENSVTSNEALSSLEKALNPAEQSSPSLSLKSGKASDLVAENNDVSPRTRSRTRREVPTREKEAAIAKPDFPADSPPDITYSGATSESSVTTEQGDLNHDKTIKVMQPELQNSWKTKGEEISSTSPCNQKDNPFEESDELVPDDYTQRTALKVSNYIHGTAFSFGHPDPRMEWKPKYNYSEVEGWLSDDETL